MYDFSPPQSVFAVSMGVMPISGNRQPKAVSKLDKKTMEAMRTMVNETNTKSR